MNANELAAQLVDDEGVKLRPYRDPVGKLTIGVGRNLEDLGITRQEAMGLLSNDISRVETELDRVFPWWTQMSDRRQQVLANMCFNLGIDRLQGFIRMLAAMQVGHFDEASAEMLSSKWAKQVGSRATRLATMMRNG
jgi:lysozyme